MNSPRINSVIQPPQPILGVLGDGDFSRPPPAPPSGGHSPHVPGFEGAPAPAPRGPSGTPAPHVPDDGDSFVPAPRPSPAPDEPRGHVNFRVPQEVAAPLAVVIIGIAVVILLPEAVVAYGVASLLLMGASSLDSGDLNQTDKAPDA